ncbi:MAG: hypothetical protein AcusKO_13360 [Acuticoccus sp.]
MHIALEKAASTTLQASLAAAADDLLAAGIAFPRIGERRGKVQRALNDALHGDAAARDLMRDTLAALAARRDVDTLVLSGETLSTFGPGTLRAFLDEAGWRDAPLTAVAIVREPAGWLNSYYAFAASLFRETRPFAAFVQRALRRGTVTWDSVFAPWIEADEAAFVAVPLAARDDPRSVVTRTLDAMGLADAPVAVAAARNEAVDPRTVEAARRLAAYRLPQPRGERQRLRRRLFETAEAAGFTGRFQGLDPRLAATIDAACRTGNDRFAQRVWGAPWAAVNAAPERAGLVPNEWRGGARNSADEAAIAHVVAAVSGAAGLERRRFAGLSAMWR